MVGAARKKFDDGRRLDAWLGDMYRADQLSIGKKEDVYRRAHSTVNADPALVAIAQERIPELEAATRARPNAHVEKKQLEYLNYLMKELTDG